MIREIDISNKFTKILFYELNLSINRLKRQCDNENYKALLLDFKLSVSESIKLIEKGKIVFGMQIMRTAFEIFMMYFAIKDNKKFEERYINLSDSIKQVDIREEASKKTIHPWEELLKYYNYLCEFSHTTLIRSAMMNLQQSIEDKDFLIATNLFTINAIISFYILELDNLYNKGNFNIEIFTLFTFFYTPYILKYINKDDSNKKRSQKYEKLIMIDKNYNYIEKRKKDIEKDSKEIQNLLSEENVLGLQGVLKSKEKTFKYKEFSKEMFLELNSSNLI